MKNRIIISSILTIALCLSMIAGSTFALFTSESKVDIAVTSGTLDVDAVINNDLQLSSLGVAQTGTFANGGTATLAGDTLTLDKLTPGDKATFSITVTNNSNVAMNYRFVWSVEGDLYPFLTATVDGVALVNNSTPYTLWDTSVNTKTFAVVVELPQGVDNDAQNKTANISFKVEAVQGNVDVSNVATTEALVYALEKGVSDITLADDVVISKQVNIPAGSVINLNLGGHTLGDDENGSYDNGALLLNRGTLRVTNGTIDTNGLTGIRTHGSAANLTCDNVTITEVGATSPEWMGTAVFVSGGSKATINGGVYTGNSSAVIVATSGGDLTINGGEFTSNNTTARVDSWSYNSTLTINGGTFNVIDDGNDKTLAFYADGYENAYINGGTFNGSIDSTYTNTYISGGTFNVSIKQPGGHQNKYVISGGTFVEDVTAYVAQGYKVTALTNNAGKYIVAADDAKVVESASDLTDAVANNETVVLASGEYTLPTSGFTADTTIICSEGTVFTGTSSLNVNGATIVGGTFENEGGKAVSGTINGTFKDCTFVGSETLRWCYTKAGETVVFENCTFETDFRGVHFDEMNGNVIFRNCYINGFNAYSGTGTITFENCVFGYSDSNYNGLNIYSNTNLINCRFEYVSGKTNFIDMEGTGKTLTITNCSATLDGVATDVSNFVGGSKLDQNTVVYN